MGQDTYSNLLLSYKIKRTYENAEKIKKFLESNFDCHLTGNFLKKYNNNFESNNYINIQDIEDDIYTNDDFLFSRETTDLYYIFYIELYECYARNISRIEYPSILGTNNITDVDVFIEKLNNAKNKFKKIDNDCKLKLIYSFHDSY